MTNPTWLPGGRRNAETWPHWCIPLLLQLYAEEPSRWYRALSVMKLECEHILELIDNLSDNHSQIVLRWLNFNMIKRSSSSSNHDLYEDPLFPWFLSYLLYGVKDKGVTQTWGAGWVPSAACTERPGVFTGAVLSAVVCPSRWIQGAHPEQPVLWGWTELHMNAFYTR